MVTGDQPGHVLVARIEGPPVEGQRGAVEVQYASAPAFLGKLPGSLQPSGRLADLAPLGGSALTLALARAARSDAADPASEHHRALALAVGPATRRRLPSSGRVHVGGVSPLTGAYTEGAVGGELAWALAGFATGLLIEGPARAPGSAGALLLVDGRDADEARGRPPRVELLEVSDLVGPQLAAAGNLDLAPALADALAARLGPDGPRALLLSGPAARRGVPYATLLAWTEGKPPLVTGRGGLGLLLAELGLVGLAVVGAEPADETRTGPLPPDTSPATSPRLAERARAGTFELFGAYAARGELAGRNYAAFLSAAEGRAIAAEAANARQGLHGCKGCPTPCGLVFERGRSKGGARFSATWALGPNLGFAAEPVGEDPSAFAAALGLLERCDDAGVDAREAGASLALLARADELDRPAPLERGGAARFGDLPALTAALASLPPVGSATLAAELELEHEHVAAQGQAARPEGNLAAVLGQVVSTGGNDPLRSFPFTVARAGHDPTDPAGKGRLLAWHEDLAAALDLAGFCGFSAAGLLVDGVLDLDALATWALPELEPGDATPGTALLEAGRALVLARRATDHELGRAGGLAPGDLPDWARAQLVAPGMLDEYLAERGLDGAGDLTEATRAWLAGDDRAPWPRPSGQLPGGPGDPAKGDRRAAAPGAPGAEQRRPGRVTLRCTGRLADLLGDRPLELPLPAPLAEVIASLAAEHPGARALLVDGEGRTLPAVWRAGRPLGPRDPVHDGDALDLLLAIAGG